MSERHNATQLGSSPTTRYPASRYGRSTRNVCCNTRRAMSSCPVENQVSPQQTLRFGSTTSNPACCSTRWAACNTTGVKWLLKRSEEHTSELQSRFELVCRLLLETNK